MKKLLILLLLMTNQTWAESRAGNGGQSIYVGDDVHLRDISETNNCKWRSGNLMMKKHPLLNKVLDSIEDVHWIMSTRLKEEIQSLKFCLTNRKLPPLSYNNSDDLYIFTNQYFDQPAINDGNVVFIDLNLFNKMPDIHKAFLLIHEASHNFFNLEEERSSREPRLRELIMNVYDHYKDPLDVESFEIILTMAKMPYLRIDTELISKDSFLEFINLNLLNEDEFKRALFLMKQYFQNEIIPRQSFFSKSFIDKWDKADQSLQSKIQEHLDNNRVHILAEYLNENLIFQSWSLSFLKKSIAKKVCSEKIVGNLPAWKSLFDRELITTHNNCDYKLLGYNLSSFLNKEDLLSWIDKRLSGSLSDLDRVIDMLISVSKPIFLNLDDLKELATENSLFYIYVSTWRFNNFINIAKRFVEFGLSSLKGQERKDFISYSIKKLQNNTDECFVNPFDRGSRSCREQESEVRDLIRYLKAQ